MEALSEFGLQTREERFGLIVGGMEKGKAVKAKKKGLGCELGGMERVNRKQQWIYT